MHAIFGLEQNVNHNLKHVFLHNAFQAYIELIKFLKHEILVSKTQVRVGYFFIPTLYHHKMPLSILQLLNLVKMGCNAKTNVELMD